MATTKTKLSKLLFYVTCTLIPLNLGYHFIAQSAYVGGLLIDYLIPTIFIQDILVTILLIVWVWERKIAGGKYFSNLLSAPYAVTVALFLFSTLLSTFLSSRFVPSLTAFIRLILYALFSLYVSKEFDRKKDFRILAQIFTWQTLLLGLLGIGQWLRQGSLFNNYLVLGEQPYSFSTIGIVHENVFGFTKIPVYGLFRHPNIFGGFLTITLVWAIYGYRQGWLEKKLFWVTVLTGVTALVATISASAWVVFLVGILLVMFSYSRRILSAAFVLISIVFGISVLLPVLPATGAMLQNPSYLRRANLLSASYDLISQRHYLFGVGYNNFTAQVERTLSLSNDLRFVQPVHNIFVLVATEVGLTGILLFILLWVKVLKDAFTYHTLLFISLILVFLLGCFDHYFLTVQQPLLLLWLLFGISAGSLGATSEEQKTAPLEDESGL